MGTSTARRHPSGTRKPRAFRYKQGLRRFEDTLACSGVNPSRHLQQKKKDAYRVEQVSTSEVRKWDKATRNLSGLIAHEGNPCTWAKWGRFVIFPCALPQTLIFTSIWDTHKKGCDNDTFRAVFPSIWVSGPGKPNQRKVGS